MDGKDLNNVLKIKAYLCATKVGLSDKARYEKVPFKHGAAIFEAMNKAGSYSEFMNMIRWFSLIPNDNRYELQGSARMQTIFLPSARMKYGQQLERSRQKRSSRQH